MAAKYWLMTYDIPEASGLENPSGFLRDRAVRVNLSDWVIPNSLIPYTFIEEYRSRGARIRIVPFAAEGEADLLDWVRESIVDAVRENTDGVRNSLDGAAARCQGADAGKKLDAAEKRFGRISSDCLKRTEELIGDLAEAARGFGITDLESEGFFRSGLAAVLTYQSVMFARARAYVAATRRAAQLGTGLEGAARRDRLPAGVLSDVMRENGEDELADALAGEPWPE